MNPFLYRKKTLEWCKAKGIAVQAYRALRDGKAFQVETARRAAMAERQGGRQPGSAHQEARAGKGTGWRGSWRLPAF